MIIEEALRAALERSMGLNPIFIAPARPRIIRADKVLAKSAVNASFSCFTVINSRHGAYGSANRIRTPRKRRLCGRSGGSNPHKSPRRDANTSTPGHYCHRHSRFGIGLQPWRGQLPRRRRHSRYRHWVRRWPHSHHLSHSLGGRFPNRRRRKTRQVQSTASRLLLPGRDHSPERFTFAVAARERRAAPRAFSRESVCAGLAVLIRQGGHRWPMNGRREESRNKYTAGNDIEQ